MKSLPCGHGSIAQTSYPLSIILILYGKLTTKSHTNKLLFFYGSDQMDKLAILQNNANNPPNDH